jgi:hypothetical protein
MTRSPLPFLVIMRHNTHCYNLPAPPALQHPPLALYLPKLTIPRLDILSTALMRPITVYQRPQRSSTRP